jgi:hypothetical protein
MPMYSPGAIHPHPPRKCQDNGPATNFDANQPIRWDLIWHLFDVTGDGRDDLIVQIPKPGTCATCTGWFLYRAAQIGNAWTFSSTGTDLGIDSNFDQDSNFTDITGDGLPDLVFGNPQFGLSVRALERDTGANNPAFKFEATARTVTFVGFETDAALSFGTSERDVLRSGDLTGDGIGDLLLQVSKIRSGVQCNGGTCGPCGGLNQPICQEDLLAACPTPGQTSCIVPRPNPIIPTRTTWQNASVIDAERNDPQRNVISQANYFVTARVQAAGANFVVTAGQCVGPGANPAFCDDVGSNLLSASLADLNGDGLADVFLRYRQSGNGSSRIDRFAYRLNRGGNSLSNHLLPEQGTGFTLPRTQADRLQLADINGDKRTDLVYQSTCQFTCPNGLNPLVYRRFETTGFGLETSAVSGSSAVLGNQNPDRYLVLPMDVNGDGAADLIRYLANNSSSQNMYVVPSITKYGGNDFIVQFTNGFGVTHRVNYAPLVSKFTYERAFDGPRKVWGRGSVVFDVFSPLWAVRDAYSSSPGCAPDALTCSFGSAAELNATSSIRYSYQGARVQTGGRGFLGFASIRTEDIQNKLLTTTEYRQDYPYIGRPSRTIVQKLTSVINDPCLLDPLNPICFEEPPDNCGGGICPRPFEGQNLRASNLNGQPYRFMSGADPIITDTSNTYTSIPVFAPAIQQTIAVYSGTSEEKRYDLTTQTLTQRVVTSMGQDKYANLFFTDVTTFDQNNVQTNRAQAIPTSMAAPPHRCQ